LQIIPPPVSISGPSTLAPPPSITRRHSAMPLLAPAPVSFNFLLLLDINIKYNITFRLFCHQIMPHLLLLSLLLPLLPLLLALFLPLLPLPLPLVLFKSTLYLLPPLLSLLSLLPFLQISLLLLYLLILGPLLPLLEFLLPLPLLGLFLPLLEFLLPLHLHLSFI
jgi:hypothetical protein